METLPEYLVYALTMIYPNSTKGGTYGISNGADIKPYLNDLLACKEVKVIAVGENSYILTMDSDLFFTYAEQLMEIKVYNKDKEEFIYKPKYIESLGFDKFLAKHVGEVQTVGLYSTNDSIGVVKDGVSYLGLHLTYEDALPFLEKHNCVVKVGSAALPPKEVLNHLYNDKSIGQCFECNRTNTGCLLTIKIGA